MINLARREQDETRSRGSSITIEILESTGECETPDRKRNTVEPMVEPRHRRHSDRRRQSLEGLSEATYSVFPRAMVQTSIVHLIRNSLSFVSWKDRKAILPSIKGI